MSAGIEVLVSWLCLVVGLSTGPSTAAHVGEVRREGSVVVHPLTSSTRVVTGVVLAVVRLAVVGGVCVVRLRLGLRLLVLIISRHLLPPALISRVPGVGSAVAGVSLVGPSLDVLPVGRAWTRGGTVGVVVSLVVRGGGVVPTTLLDVVRPEVSRARPPVCPVVRRHELRPHRGLLVLAGAAGGA